MLKSFLGHAEMLGFRRRWIAAILALQFASVLFEGIGIGMFLPILELVSSQRSVADLASDSQLWQVLVDAFDTVGLEPSLGPLLGAAFSAFLLRQAFLAAKLLTLNHVKFTFMRDVRRQTFRRFLAADMARHDRVSAGEFANELTQELNAATGGLLAYVNYVGHLTVCAVYGAGLLTLSLEMTLATFLCFGITALLLSGLMRKSRDAGKAVTIANQSLSKFLLERIQSIRLIRLSGMETAEQASIEGLTDEQCDRLIRLSKISTMLTVAIEPIILLGAFVVFFVSIENLEVAPERVMLLFVAILRLLPVVKEAMVRRQVYVGATEAIRIIHHRLDDLARSPETFPPGAPFTAVREAIRFENVRFAFEPAGETPALNGVSTTIPAGRITALVGPSGAGKSTMIDMLPRLRRPQDGRITIDGIDVADIDLRALRSGIAFVSQFPSVLDMTLADYIGYGIDAPDRTDIAEAARLANADDFIRNLPNGFDERLGEAGNRLSGGQRQRVDLARALARRAPLIVLDEPTSNLDAGSERAIVGALSKIRDGGETTVVIVAHRPSSVLIADHIIVVEAGRVVAEGDHKTLMKENAWYRDVLHAQDTATATA